MAVGPLPHLAWTEIRVLAMLMTHVTVNRRVTVVMCQYVRDFQPLRVPCD